MNNNKNMNNYISTFASLPQDLHLGRDIKIYGKVKAGHRCFISDNVTIGLPSEEDIEHALGNGWNGNLDDFPGKEIVIQNDVIIQPYVVISRGVFVGEKVKIGPYVSIGKNSIIGPRTHLMYRSQVYENVAVGSNCKIAGFLCDFASVGNETTVMGSLLHRYEEGWNEALDLRNCSPIIEDNVIIGYGSLIVGKVRIRSRTYVAAGAIATKDTPGNCVVRGVNGIQSIEQYTGKYLRSSRWFARE